MQNQIIRYRVQNLLLKKYIKFFWELHIDRIQLDHKIIPQRNINMRFNLNDTSHFICQNGDERLLEDVYFVGLQNQYTNACLKLNGEVNILGICFEPDGIYPFLKIPVSEFKNRISGTDEIGFKKAKIISEKLKEVSNVKNRLAILENELLMLLDYKHNLPVNFKFLIQKLNQNNTFQINDFCKETNIGLRKLERLFDKYVGLPASTYNTLNRFHRSLNQLIHNGYFKLSDLAYDNAYFDQTHFNREFKRFTGNTPKYFVSQNNSILQIGRMN